MTGYLLILAIILLGGAIATVGDRIGSRVGKARLSLFKLRPKKTAVLVTILTGSVTAATTMGVLLAANKQLRDMLFRSDLIIRQNRKVNQALEKAQAQKLLTEKELSGSRAELIEAVRRLRNVNDSLKIAVTRQKVSEASLKKLKSRYELAQTTLRTFGTQAKNLRSQIGQLSAQKQRLSAEQQRLIEQRNQIQARLKQADTQKQQLEAAAAQARQRIQSVEQEKQRLESAIAQSKAQLQTAIAQQTQLQQSILEVGAQLQQATAAQTTLRQERIKLETEIATLDETRQRLLQSQSLLLQGLRLGNVTIRAGQVLASGIIQIRNSNSRDEAIQAINTLRLQARRNAIVLTNPRNLRPDAQVVEITQTDVEKLIVAISDGQPHVVRILSAVNYLEGEALVIAVPQTVPNRLIFEQGAVVATLPINPATLTDEQILARINALFIAANRRAIESGVLPDPVSGTVGSFRQIELFRFVLALKAQNETALVDIQAVTAEQVSSSGPLVLNLVALRKGQVILKSN